jgi:F1F0 ATPase subunit 2
MSPFLSLAWAWVAGTGLGLFYFGGLWFTVQRLPTCRWPAPLVLASFVGRTAVVVVGFYFVMGGRWERVLACLVGFIVVRLVLVSRLRAELASDTPRGKEAA